MKSAGTMDSLKASPALMHIMICESNRGNSHPSSNKRDYQPW